LLAFQFVWFILCFMMKNAIYRTSLAIFALLCIPNTVTAAENSTRPFADIHIHYNWDHEELTTPDEVIRILEENNVTLAVVFSTPTPNTLKLTGKNNLHVIHFFSPYITAYKRSNWFRDESILQLARAGLQDRDYAGIGEVHVVSGLGPHRDNRVLQGLLRLAAEFNVPFSIHTEASSYRFLQPLCQQHASVRFLWAHAGGNLPPDNAIQILKVCPNVWLEVSAKDPWHYGGLTDEHGKLRTEWRKVFIQHPDRFMLGTDPVWNAQQVNRWDDADTGWSHYRDLIDYHRNWLAELPEDVEKKIRLDNALQFFVTDGSPAVAE